MTHSEQWSLYTEGTRLTGSLSTWYAVLSYMASYVSRCSCRSKEQLKWVQCWGWAESRLLVPFMAWQQMQAVGCHLNKHGSKDANSCALVSTDWEGRTALVLLGNSPSLTFLLSEWMSSHSHTHRHSQISSSELGGQRISMCFAIIIHHVIFSTAVAK